MNRKEFLTGAAGLAIGAPLGAAAMGALPAKPAPKCPPHDHISHAQAGEDPILINNTYFCYQYGFQGVLVEPNVDLTPKLRSVRPRDIVLEAGIGTDKPGVADYYVMTDPAWNTFDKAEADHQTKVTGGRIRVREVRKMPLLDVNEVMAKHFKGKAPAFVSIDAEGWHFAILKSIDFARFRPAVICVETLVSGESRTIPEIPALMTTKGCVARGGSFVNTIFVDSKLF